MPTNVYGAAKAAGELYARTYCKTYGLPIVIVRLFNTYGPREHAVGRRAEVIPRFVMRTLAGQPSLIFGTGQQTRDFTYVDDIVCSKALFGLAGFSCPWAAREGRLPRYEGLEAILRLPGPDV